MVGGAGPILALFGGAAGAGKSTLARGWCAARDRAALIELDQIRDLIAGGRADPQTLTPVQAEQYDLSAAACAALARVYLANGYDAAITDVFEPDAWVRVWQPLLADCSPRLVVLHPPLEQVLARAATRGKRVQERHIISQHAASAGWPAQFRLDTGERDIETSLRLVQHQLNTPASALPLPQR